MEHCAAVQGSRTPVHYIIRFQSTHGEEYLSYPVGAGSAEVLSWKDQASATLYADALQIISDQRANASNETYAVVRVGRTLTDCYVTRVGQSICNLDINRINSIASPTTRCRDFLVSVPVPPDL